MIFTLYIFVNFGHYLLIFVPMPFFLAQFWSAFAFLFLLLIATATPLKFRPHSDGPTHDHHSRGHSSHQAHHGRRQQQHQDEEEGVTSPNACGCGGHPGAGGASQWMQRMPAHGIPLFLFPDNVMRSVDIVLRSENAFHRDNDDLARHLFHLLAHQFSRKWFIVGVGTVPTTKDARVPRIWALPQGMDVLNGTVQLKAPPGYSGGFPFLDGRRFRRENGSQLWYFVCAIEPTTTTDEAATQNLAKCLAKKRCSPLDEFVSMCARERSPLGMAVQFGQNLAMSIFASEPLTLDRKTMALAREAPECMEENDGEEKREKEENDGEKKREEQQHILVVVAPKGEKS